MTISLLRFFCAGPAVLGLALLMTACLTPPERPETAQSAVTEASCEAAREAVAPDKVKGASAPEIVQGPREFSHSSMELMKELGLGWNLGNSLDAPEGETHWGNPAVTPKLLQAVAASGFRLVRIPVTWTKHTKPGPDFTIDPGFLARVREVVGYAHAAGLYTVINIHHDGADGFEEVEWLTLNDASGQTTEENNEQVRTRFVAVWQQIAAAFEDFGEELIFESMNEIHDGYGQPDPRHMEFINQLNQTFVRLTRASGKNNEQRHLIVPGYNTNVDHTLTGFVMPDDSTKGRIILSVHYYDPYLFALQAKTHTWGADSPGSEDWGQEDFVVKQFDRLKERFIDQGVPIIIGEYGATHQKGYEDYRRYYMEYVTKAAVDRGLVPVYWDNGGKNSGAESFGLFDRSTGRVLHPAILEAMLRATKEKYSLSDISPPRPSKCR